MGFLFGNSKKKAEEEERILAERKEQERKNEIEEAKAAHVNLHWPTNPRINRMNAQDPAAVVEDPLTPERKDEVGALIYEPSLTQDAVQALNLQELLFLHAAHLLYNKEAALPNYETNHRVIYNDILRRVHEAAEIYVIFDKISGYPLIDAGFINIYLDKEHAEKASAIYNSQFRKTVVIARPGENAPEDENGKRPVNLFDYLCYIGTENIMIDNGWYKAPIKRSEMTAPINFGADPAKTPPTNPALCYTMTDFVQEISWPVKYDHRDEIVKKKQERMFQFLPKARLIVPTMVQDAAAGENGENAAAGKKEVKFPVMNAKDQKFLPVYTDIAEYARNRKTADGYRPAGFEYKNLVGLLGGVDGIIINPAGQKVIIPKAKALSLVAEEKKA